MRVCFFTQLVVVNKEAHLTARYRHPLMHLVEVIFQAREFKPTALSSQRRCHEMCVWRLTISVLGHLYVDLSLLGRPCMRLVQLRLVVVGLHGAELFLDLCGGDPTSQPAEGSLRLRHSVLLEQPHRRLGHLQQTAVLNATRVWETFVCCKWDALQL